MRYDRNHISYAQCVVCVMLLFQNVMAQSQEKIYYEQFTSEDGLSENVVYCVHQDRQGFIWAGTDYGLNRFDGYHFTHYHRQNADTTTLSSYSVLSISEDDDGMFWLGTHVGLNYFDPNTGKAERMPIPGKGLNYGVADIHDLDNEHLLVLLEGVSLYRFRKSDRTFTALTYPDGYGSAGYRILHFPGDRAGVPIARAGDESLIALLNASQSGLEFKTLKELLPFCQIESAIYYFLDNQGNHYVFSQRDHAFHVYRADGVLMNRTDPFPVASLSPLDVFSIVQVDERHVWIGTNLGLVVYDNRTHTMAYPELVGDCRSLSGNKEIRDLLPDRSGNVWIGVFGEGILRCDNRTIPFSHLTLPEITQNKMTRMIFGLHAWPDNVIAAETNYFNFSLIKDGRSIGVVSANELSVDALVQIATGKSMQSLSAFQQTYFDSLAKISKTFFPHFAFLPNDTTVIHYGFRMSVHTPRWEKTLIHTLVKNVVEDSDCYWASTAYGLYRIDKQTYSDTVYQYEYDNPHSLSESHLYYVALDHKQNLWIGTKGGGLNGFDRVQNTFFHYTTEDGLPDNVVYFILPDHDGNLWLTTNKGISRFDPVQRTFSTFTRRDGLLNTEFNSLGGVMLPDGHMYFSGTNGIDYFDPREVQISRQATAVYLSEWKVNNVSVPIHHFNSLRYSQNNVAFYFTTNDFIRPDLVYFRYRINPAEEWTRVQGVNFVSYNALRPGLYNFEVQASYDNLNWTPGVIQHFRIQTPWWLSWWFRMIVLATILGAFFLFYHYRIEQLKQLQRMRSKISQDLHDEVGSTLSSIHVYSSVATKALNANPETTREALNQIKQNSQEVMENMSDIVWAINTGNHSQMSLEDKLKNYGYELLTPLGIQCLYHIDKEAERKLMNIEARKNVLLIAKEAMNNIAKYSSATEAKFLLSLTNGYLQMQITDNGTGFNRDIKRKGNGLFNMQQRTETLGGKFTLETAEPGGTTIRCLFPLHSISLQFQ